MNRPLRALVLDIETCPIVASVWGLKDQNIGLNQIRRDWAIIAFGAKWLDAPASEVIYHDLRHYRHFDKYNRDVDDTPLLKILWRLLDEADIVITQNGQSFDGPKITARMLIKGMRPYSGYRHLDTYRISKRIAEFTSNKLEYVTDKVNKKYKKLSHGAFPGMSLWTECEKGNIKAWNAMKEYNIWDVLSTEEYYNAVKAWSPETMAKPYAVVGNKRICGNCGGTLASRGRVYTNNAVYQELRCRQCSASSKGGKIQ